MERAEQTKRLNHYSRRASSRGARNRVLNHYLHACDLASEAETVVNALQMTDTYARATDVYDEYSRGGAFPGCQQRNNDVCAAGEDRCKSNGATIPSTVVSDDQTPLIWRL